MSDEAKDQLAENDLRKRLEAENAALREAAQVASQLESLINAQSPSNYREDGTPTTPIERLRWIVDRFASIRKENAALREDKARLDDVERQVPDGFDWTITRLDAGGWKVEPLRIGAELGWGPHYPTARAAIDAARKGEKG